MATLLVLILATVASNTINASPLPAASSTPTLTETGLLPAYTGISTPYQSLVPTATGVPHTRKGNDSPFPTFDASQYPRHNFTGHHGNNTHHYCEHGNGAVDRIIKDLDDVRHRKNSTHHVNGTHCRNDTDSHRPVPSGHAKLVSPNGDHQKRSEARRLQDEGYPFVELSGRNIDTEVVPEYVRILNKDASSSSSPSTTVKAEKVKRDTINSGEDYLASVAYSKLVVQRDVNDKYVPASVRYMEYVHKHAPPPREQDQYIPASVKYMEYYKKHAPMDRTEFAKRGEEDNDGLVSWEFLSKSDLSLFRKRDVSNCVDVAGGVLCKKDAAQHSEEGTNNAGAPKHISRSPKVNEERMLLDCNNVAARVQCKPLTKRDGGDKFWRGQETTIPAHIHGLD